MGSWDDWIERSTATSGSNVEKFVYRWSEIGVGIKQGGKDGVAKHF